MCGHFLLTSCELVLLHLCADFLIFSISSMHVVFLSLGSAVVQYCHCHIIRQLSSRIEFVNYHIRQLFTIHLPLGAYELLKERIIYVKCVVT